MFLSIVDGAHGAGNRYVKCWGKKIVEDFKKCILQRSVFFIREINLKSYKQAPYLNELFAAQIILPEDGSVGAKQNYKPNLKLDPLFVYILCLFDRDFLLYVSNPLIVSRSCIKINQYSKHTRIAIKV